VALGVDASMNSKPLDSMTGNNAKAKVQERLEKLLSPEAKSLSMTIISGVGKPGKKVKEAAIVVLDKYVSFSLWFLMAYTCFSFRLLDYTTDDKNNGRITIINVPENKFADWLVAYRMAATQQPEDEDDYGWGRN